MVNYENAKIYKLVCNKRGLIYVGSTCQRLLCKRLSGHVADYKRWKNTKCKYITSCKIIDNGDYYIELIEAVSCSSFDELAKKERYYVESIDCVNKMIPGRTLKEWGRQYYEINKETHNAYSKQYAQDNEEKLKAKRSVKVKCPNCGCEVRKDGISKHKRTIKCQNTADTLLEINELN